MNLVIDIGNTLAKVAITDGENIVSIDRHESLSAEIIDNAIKKYAPSKAIVSCVGHVNPKIIQHLVSIIPTISFDCTTKIPITNLYKTPETLGVDRLAATIGANSLYPSTDLLVIGCGTAITYDLLTQKGEYLGGAISPGITLRFKSLHRDTANLPLIQRIGRVALIGGSTNECIESGVLNGIIGEVEHYINRVKANYPSLKVLMTGGDADFFVDNLKNSIFVVQNLVIIGLNRILELNSLGEKDS